MNQKVEDINALLQKMQLPPLAQLLGAKFLFSSHLDSPLAGFVEGVVICDGLENLEILSSVFGADRADGRGNLIVSSNKSAGYHYFIHGTPHQVEGEFIIL